MEEGRYWFRRKWYGWGWYPATWQGWTVMVVWILLFVLGEVEFVSRLDENPSPELFVGFFLYLIVLVAALIGICYRYGEKPRWQWGRPKDDESI